jgi:hypothetical protein
MRKLYPQTHHAGQLDAIALCFIETPLRDRVSQYDNLGI